MTNEKKQAVYAAKRKHNRDLLLDKKNPVDKDASFDARDTTEQTEEEG